jgi:serine/threonine-protein kinase HipA
MKGMDYNALRVHDYAQLFDTAVELNLSYESLDEFFRRMVFNIAFSNNDDHTRNHAFLLEEGKGWAPAPAYDVTHAHGSSHDAWTKTHIMGVGGVFSDITRKDVLRLSAPYPIKNPGGIIDCLLDVADSWTEFAKQAGLSAPRAQRVGEDIAACSKLLRRSH